jgi:hypothetical protein
LNESTNCSTIACVGATPETNHLSRWPDTTSLTQQRFGRIDPLSKLVPETGGEPVFRLTWTSRIWSAADRLTDGLEAPGRGV